MLRLLALLLAVCAFGQEPVQAIRFGRLWDGKGKIWTNAVVVVEGGRIRSVGKSVPRGAKVVDLSKFTGLPGLIDVHTHLTYVGNGDRPPDSGRLALRAGVTTVRDLGGANQPVFAMREDIAAQRRVGPRMFVSGSGLVRSKSPQGVAAIESHIRAQAAAGADWIKMFGSTGSGRDVSGTQTFTFEEMKAAVATAHSLGRRIAIHSYGPDGARDAVRAGADSVEHATDMDEATIAEMVRRGTFYVPTVDHNRYYADNAKQWGWSDEVIVNLNDYIARNLQTLQRAVKAGVRIAMGSDVVRTMHGQNTRELDWFVKAGMTPEQALRAATVNGATLLGREKELGAIAPGYTADLIAVDGNPLEDIQAVIRNVRWVMKGGQVIQEK